MCDGPAAAGEFAHDKHERTVTSAAALNNLYVHDAVEPDDDSNRSLGHSEVLELVEESVAGTSPAAPHMKPLLWKGMRDGILPRRRSPQSMRLLLRRNPGAGAVGSLATTSLGCRAIDRGEGIPMGVAPSPILARTNPGAMFLEGRTKREIDCGAEASQPGRAGHYRR